MLGRMRKLCRGPRRGGRLDAPSRIDRATRSQTRSYLLRPEHQKSTEFFSLIKFFYLILKVLLYEFSVFFSFVEKLIGLIIKGVIKNLWDSPWIVSFGTQILGTKMHGFGSLVRTQFLVLYYT